tara:strand:- start:1108 stop:1248 length:141 start_codon:yes stop_codon:yes gene_type:complete
MVFSLSKNHLQRGTIRFVDQQCAYTAAQLLNVKRRSTGHSHTTGLR